MKKIALIFPGQGSQKPGMGADLVEKNFPAYRQTMDSADRVLGFGLSQVMLSGTEDELKETKIAQLAIYAMSCGILAELRIGFDKVACVAGHSLGEYSALVASGALSFETGLRLVERRATFMAEAAAANSGGMIAVLGLNREAVDAVLADFALSREVAGAASENSSAFADVSPAVANHNSPEQIVISGPGKLLSDLEQPLAAAGAKKVITLKVSGAFHSELMREAADRFQAAVAAADIAPTGVPLIGNTSGRAISTSDEIRSELTRQITGPVEWVNSLNTASALGADTFVEIGPGKVLSGLVKRTLTGCTILNIETAANLAGLAEAGLADSIRSNYVHA